MSKRSINFDDKKSDFYKKNKKIFNIDDIDINKILVSKKEQYGKYNSFKYFIGYNDNDVIRPLYLGLSQMTGYIKKFKENKTITMSFRVKDKQVLKIFNKIWEKIESSMSTYFESKPVYGDGDKNSVNTNFHNKKLPKEKASCKCFSIIILDSVVKTNKKYYPQTF